MRNKKFINIIVDNVKTIFYALLIATIFRSLLFQPFYIPSSSMEPQLLIGDRIFVSKYSYGFSRHSFPFSPFIISKRINYTQPKRGDLIVFKTPQDNRTDYIKRLIGLPGDEIQFISGEILINGKKIIKKITNQKLNIRCGSNKFNVKIFEETLPNGVKYFAAYNSERTFQNSDKYVVPDNHFFFLGDNRDCSKDSRYLTSVGYVNYINLVGKAQIIFFSNDTIKGSVLKIWNWDKSFRFKRFFKKI
jgi:signal peptidase I